MATKKTVNTNVGRAQTTTTPRGAYKATPKVRSETKGGVDSPSAIKAKAERTKRALAAEQTARRKAGEGSAARTKAQIKKDENSMKKGNKSSINQGMPSKPKPGQQATKMNQTQVKKAQATRATRTGGGGKAGGFQLPKLPGSRKWPFNN